MTVSVNSLLKTILAALSGAMVERCEVARFYPSLLTDIDKTGEQQ
jgi:hypothetical protein